MKARINFLIKFGILLLALAFIFNSCDKSTSGPQNQSTSLRFVFDDAGNQPGPSLIANKKHVSTGNGVFQPAGTSKNGNFSLQKANEINEAKVLLLDMTQWDNYEQFIEAWYSSGQNQLWDSAGWDSTRDYWDNASALLNSYTGEFYTPGGEYNLNIEQATASGTITVKPGLNYFFVALRENGRTVYSDEVFYNVMEGEENIIRVQARAALFIEIYSPQDSAVYQQNQEVFLNGFAEDELNYTDIPDSNYVWTSDKDGELGRGSYVVASGLSQNHHRITLRVTTTGGISGEKSVEIDVLP